MNKLRTLRLKTVNLNQNGCFLKKKIAILSVLYRFPRLQRRYGKACLVVVIFVLMMSRRYFASSVSYCLVCYKQDAALIVYKMR